MEVLFRYLALCNHRKHYYLHSYEDSNVFGGYIEQDIEIALPLGMDASYFVLLSQDSNGLKKVKEIKVN